MEQKTPTPEQMLKQHIAELDRRHQEINERLRNPRGIRKGNSFGSNIRGGLHQTGSLRGVVHKPDDEDQPPAKKRLLSAVVKADDESLEKVVTEKPDATVVVEKGDHKSMIGNDAEESGRPTAQALYQRRDSWQGLRGVQEHNTFSVEPLPRVLIKEENPNLVKRNQRMFGALMGTLERFKQEDRQLSASDAFSRRSNSLKRAEQKAQDESERLRQQERERLAERRHTDLTLRARIAAKTEEKKLELLFIHWSEHYKRLSKFLRTKAEPPIFFIPAKTSEEVEKILDNQQKDFLEWQNMRREELSKYNKEWMEQHLAEADAEFERWSSRRNARYNKVLDSTARVSEKAATEGALGHNGILLQEEEDVEDTVDMADVEFANNVLEEDEPKNDDTDIGG